MESVNCNDDNTLPRRQSVYKTVSIVMMIIDKVIPDCEYCNDDNN